MFGSGWPHCCAKEGISIKKPRHAAGYSVDAEIVNGNRQLLVEIKSNTTASDIHSAIGQLQLYRKLLPRLADHVPVLLLPKLPQSVIVKAIRDCGIELCTFTFFAEAKRYRLNFRDQFLQELCGLVGES